ncbi:MAG: hypothetical protein H6721_11630 [Sandaracinus sp.]|nr:hypothetical protein [Myxococcales bacterium]MCB9600321.1 hypothetical protein [Sandaracinus sp.]MCB9613097.1 hypothetical protein [Sandaracinus sp.]MCB9624646.1 hypothetical protein [Sandaracinus sp.]MCB9632773.1 hypothetical protein [Sandaracinus sp.]
MGCSVVVNGKLDDKDGDGGVGDGGVGDGGGGDDGSLPTCDDAACDDGEPCNGVERCADDVCALGTPLAEGDACSTEAIDEGTCRVSGSGFACAPLDCGNSTVDEGEQCDDGNDVDGDGCDIDCQYSCESGDDCDDGLACNGVETCDAVTHACVLGEAVTCTPSDDCHTSECDEEAAGCAEKLIDFDGDGYASTDLGECGDDCADDDPDSYPGAPEGCGAPRDWDCDGTASSGNAIWYPDCDGDGFAAEGVGGTAACPAPAPQAGCMAWTLAPPTSASTTDCNDTNANMFPGQSMYFTSAHPAIPSGATGNDARYGSYDCNGTANFQYGTTSLYLNASTTIGCGLGRDSRGSLRCGGDIGWTTSTAPDCGVSGTWTECPGEPTRCSGTTELQCPRHVLACDGRATLASDPCYCPPRTTCAPDCTIGSRDCPWGYFLCTRVTETRRMGCR